MIEEKRESHHSTSIVSDEQKVKLNETDVGFPPEGRARKFLDSMERETQFSRGSKSKWKSWWEQVGRVDEFAEIFDNTIEELKDLVNFSEHETLLPDSINSDVFLTIWKKRSSQLSVKIEKNIKDIENEYTERGLKPQKRKKVNFYADSDFDGGGSHYYESAVISEETVYPWENDIRMKKLVEEERLLDMINSDLEFSTREGGLSNTNKFYLEMLSSPIPFLGSLTGSVFARKKQAIKTYQASAKAFKYIIEEIVKERKSASEKIITSNTSLSEKLKNLEEETKSIILFFKKEYELLHDEYEKVLEENGRLKEKANDFHFESNSESSVNKKELDIESSSFVLNEFEEVEVSELIQQEKKI
jgi:hypothetical protein